jgi:tetratricopeptide (TPR) repeat protein
VRSPTAAAPIVLIVGDDEAAVRERAAALLSSVEDSRIVEATPAAVWPFSYPLAALPGGRVAIAAYDAHRAFETAQPPHTRLVTTQAHYVFTEWAASLEAHGQATLVVTLQRASIARHAPEVLQQRGIFGRVAMHDADTDREVVLTSAPEPEPGGDSAAARLARAFRQTDAAERLRQSVGVLDMGRTAAALVATASVCQEVNDLESAARDLDEAIALAPGWAAAHFERGKVWLRRDDMEMAAGAFRAATECLPEFGGAWGNLGATLGELDRTAEALDAFEHLLALDPASPQAHNNIGVVTRELGRLNESDAAFRRVIELEPNLAVGYYNLGHTLFLQGRYHAAASAYAQGQGRDPERNPVQAARLALCRLATGDAAGALAELQRASGALPREYRRQVLADTSAVLWALVTTKPDLTGWQGVHDWLNAELARLA